MSVDVTESDVEDAYNPQQLIDEDVDGDEDIDVEM